MIVKILILCLSGLFYLTGCSNAQQEGRVIAEVNGNKLTYEYLLSQLPEEYRSSLTGEQLSSAVETWIETELVYQEALAHNIDKNQVVKNMIEQKRKEIIAFKFMEMSISSQIDISDAEIDSIYNSQKERFSIGEDLFKLSHIVLGSKNAADAVYKRLKSGDDFASLAKDYSEDSDTRRDGGNIGLLSLSAFEKNMVEVINKLKIGQFTPPILAQSGYYHIFFLHEIKLAGETLPLEEIRADITQTIAAEKRQANYVNLLNRLKSTANIKRYPLDDKK